MENGVSNRCLDFREDFNKTSETRLQTQARLYSAIGISADSADVNFSKFHSAYKLLTKENETISPAKCPAHLVPKTAKKGCDTLSCDTEAFIMKVFGYFSISSKHAEELNEILDFVEMEGDGLLRHMPTR